MNRTERLYAVVEELRAAAPAPRTVERLARGFGVSARTIQRDLRALEASGVPVRAEAGPRGGWFIDSRMTLPPLNLTADEALAVAVAIAGAEDNAPFSASARTVLRKLLGVLTPDAAESVRALAGQIRAIPAAQNESVRNAVDRAVRDRRVLWMRYRDAKDRGSTREVEPAGLLTADGRWYLLAWCRTQQAPRAFRMDRIEGACPLTEAARRRDLSALLGGALTTSTPSAFADLT